MLAFLRRTLYFPVKRLLAGFGPDLVKLLQQGSVLWNHWREQHPNQQLDLRGASLSYARLENTNLMQVNLSGANLSYARLRNANLSYADLREANLSYADPSEARLKYANLRKADLHSAVNVIT